MVLASHAGSTLGKSVRGWPPVLVDRPVSVLKGDLGRGEGEERGLDLGGTGGNSVEFSTWSCRM